MTQVLDPDLQEPDTDVFDGEDEQLCEGRYVRPVLVMPLWILLKVPYPCEVKATWRGNVICRHSNPATLFVCDAHKDSVEESAEPGEVIVWDHL